MRKSENSLEYLYGEVDGHMSPEMLEQFQKLEGEIRLSLYQKNIESPRGKGSGSGGAHLFSSDPEKVVKVLMLRSFGKNPYNIHKITGIHRASVLRIVSMWEEDLEVWRKEASLVASMLLTDCNEFMADYSEELQTRLRNGEIEVTPQGLNAIGAVRDRLMKENNLIRGEATSRVETVKKGKSIDDAKLAREEALASIKEAEVVVEEEEILEIEGGEE